MNKVCFFLFAFLLFIFSCKKDEVNTDYALLTDSDLNEIKSGATELSMLVQTSMFSYVAIAADSNFYLSYPEMPSEKSTNEAGLKSTMDGWTGPDANGWYTNHIEGAYDYTERVRCCDSLVEYEYIISYDGADGSYENVNRTQYEKYTVNDKVFYRGYWDMSVSNSGYSDISDVHWKMTFEDWDPLSGAGEFDWWWGASSNGNFTPFDRYLSIVASDAGDEMLDIKITLFADSNDSWSFEYTSPWSPVEMPPLHTCNVREL